MFIYPLHCLFPWKCNPENECRETKLRDPIWSGTTSLISCTSDLWEHSGSATLWQYRGIKQMKENSLAREEIRWAEGEEKTIWSLIVLCLTATRDFRKTHFLSTRCSVQSLAWCDHINFQPVPVFLATSFLDTAIDEATEKGIGCKQTLRLTKNMQHWHLKLGILPCWLEEPNTLQVILCHPLKNVTLMPEAFW